MDSDAMACVPAGAEEEEGSGGEQQELRGVPTSRYLRQLHEVSVQKKDEQFCVWLGENGEETDARTFSQLWDRAGSIAHLLASKGLAAGDRVILCFNFGLDFLDAFLGCLRLGVVAVPIYPPNPAKLAQGLEKMALIIQDSGAKICLVDGTIDAFRRTTRGWPDTEYCIPAKARAPEKTAVGLDCSADKDVAFLQYTSGSTGNPKGVILTFGNIFDNMKLKIKLFPHASDPGVRGCSWLPQYHDMGLLLCTLYPLAMGKPFVYMSPSTFIKQPVLWLAVMSRYRCTWTVTPNFAYGLAARKFTEMDPSKRPHLDLSCVRILGNAAEPVRVATMLQFLDAFSGFGLDRAMVCSAYGLAEHTVLVSSGATELKGDPSLETAQDSSKRFVACGEWDEQGEGAGGLVDARIVAENEQGTEEMADGQLGEIWLRSPCNGQGYWGMQERSQETFGARLNKPLSPVQPRDGVDGECFLRSGDEGFFERGADGVRRLFVCGRIKDLIIVRGRNLYPQDIERSCEQASDGQVRLGCSAAYQSMEGARELPAADITCEVNKASIPAQQLSALCQTLAAAVRQEHAVKVRRLTLLKPRTIPKTTSGKIRRKETRRCVDAGELLKHSLMVWEDMTVDEEAARSARASTSAMVGGAEGDKNAAAAEFVLPATSELFLEWVLRELRSVSEEISPDDAPAALGLDSVTAHELCQKLSVRAQVEVSPADLLAADSVRAFSGHLFDLTHPDESSAASDPGTADTQPPVRALGPPLDFPVRSPSSLPPPMSPTASSTNISGPLAVSVRTMIHLALLWWVLCSIVLCALPAVIVAERFLDSDLFPVPLKLFRWLLEPRVGSLIHLERWDPAGPSALLPDPPAEPLFSNPYAAAAVGVPLAFGSFLIAITTYTILLKWVLLGRVKAGDYPLWGWLYWRRWLVMRHAEILFGVLSLVLHDAAPLALIYRLLGARLGRRCKVDALLAISDWDLVSIGDCTAVSRHAMLCTAVVVRGTLHMRTVTIGERCELQDKAVVCPGAVLPQRTRVRPNTVVAADTMDGVHAGRTVEGRPAREVEGHFEGAQGTSVFEMVVLPAAWLVCLVCSTVACLAPVVTVSDRLLRKAELSGPGLAAAVVGQYVLYLTSLCVVTLAAKWTLLGRSLQRGVVIPRGSMLEVRKECVERLNGLVHRLVLVYMWGGEWINLWYRLLGVRIAPGTVLSVGTAIGADWDAVEVGANCMLGGNTIIKTSTRRGANTVVLGVTFGDAVTTGAGSTIGAGCKLGSYSLVTSMSSLPAELEVDEHAYVVGNVVRRRLHRCYTPHQAQGGPPRYVLEPLVWVLHAASFALSLWLALYCAWLLRDGARIPGILLFPLGGGLFQLMRLLLVILVKWTVCRYPYPTDPQLDDLSCHSRDSGLSREGSVSGDLVSSSLWFPGFTGSRMRFGSRELSPEPGSWRAGGMGSIRELGVFGSGRRSSREASPEPGSERALAPAMLRPESSPSGMRQPSGGALRTASEGVGATKSDGSSSRGRPTVRQDGSARFKQRQGSREASPDGAAASDLPTWAGFEGVARVASEGTPKSEFSSSMGRPAMRPTSDGSGRWFRQRQGSSEVMAEGGGGSVRNLALWDAMAAGGSSRGRLGGFGSGRGRSPEPGSSRLLGGFGSAKSRQREASPESGSGQGSRMSAEFSRLASGAAAEGDGEPLGLLKLFGFFQELYLRHWYNVSLLGGCLKGGPLANVLFKCLRTGRMPMSAYLGSIFLFDFEYIDFEEDVAINEGVSVTPHVINSTTSCKLQRISIGEGAALWPTARCMGRTNIPSHAQVAPLSRMDPAFHSRAMRELSRLASSGLATKMLVGVPAVSFVATGFDSSGSGQPLQGGAAQAITISEGDVTVAVDLGTSPC